MTKEQTTYIKGIAILMMLFLHLFNHWNPGEYSAWLYIGELPLVNIIARACSPVGIFLMLSGYGLHYETSAKPTTLSIFTHILLEE